MPAIDVISAAMKFLKEKLMLMLDSAKINVKESDIFWVITVPAIWQGSARHLMRKAAYMVSVLFYNMLKCTLYKHLQRSV